MDQEIKQTGESSQQFQLTVERSQSSQKHHGTTDRPICRAPDHIKLIRQSDFEPMLVSIGPYYNGLEKLKGMENIKPRCAIDLIKKACPDQHSLNESTLHEVLTAQFMELELNVREYYTEKLDVKYNQGEELIYMLGIDSCFIIGVVLTFFHATKVQPSMAFLGLSIKEVRADLLLMENQIPFFFIKKVYAWLTEDAKNYQYPNFEKLFTEFLFTDMPWGYSSGKLSRGADHLLALYWQASSPPGVLEPEQSTPRQVHHTARRRMLGLSWGPMRLKLTWISKLIGWIKHCAAGDHTLLRYYSSPKEEHSMETQGQLPGDLNSSKRFDCLPEQEHSTETKGQLPGNLNSLKRFDCLPEQEHSMETQSQLSDDHHSFKTFDSLSEQEHSIHSQELHICAATALSVFSPQFIPNATVLHRMAGITFKNLNDASNKNENVTAPGLVVTFSNGIMKMPCLKIHSAQTRLLVNLIAFENSMQHEHRYVSNYMKLMDALIDTEEDIELLQQCGVIRNRLSNHELAATFFNDIGNLCVVDNRIKIFSSIYNDVLKYYESEWNRVLTILRNKYFSSPWAGMSVGAGVTLLILTVLQTFFTIYAYYRPLSPAPA